MLGFFFFMFAEFQLSSHGIKNCFSQNQFKLFLCRFLGGLIKTESYAIIKIVTVLSHPLAI